MNLTYNMQTSTPTNKQTDTPTNQFKPKLNTYSIYDALRLNVVFSWKYCSTKLALSFVLDIVTGYTSAAQGEAQSQLPTSDVP